MNNTQHKYSLGFTMIELLVAIGIFGVLLIIVSGIFSRFMLIERHGIAEGQLISDLRSGMESFTKEARTAYGSTYNVTSSGNEIAFRNQAGECVSYRVNNRVLQRAAVGNIGSDCIAGSLNDALFSPLTGTQTNISSIHFNPIIANTAGSKLLNQGVVTVSITASSSTSDIIPIQLQNTITSRQMSPYAQ